MNKNSVMTESSSEKHQLKAFINAAQYLAGLTSSQDIWKEAGKVLIEFFGADFAAFGKLRADGSIEISHRTFSGKDTAAPLSDERMIAAVREVFETGFLTFAASAVSGDPGTMPTSPSQDCVASVAFFPVLHLNHVTAVMLVGHQASDCLSRKDALDLYLAVAGLIGAAYTRDIAAKAVLQAKQELEQRVALRTAQLENSNREREAFAYSVSHDLRSPLRSIEGFSLALLEDYSDKLDGQGKSYLDRVRRATLRMGHLIDDLLKLSRIT